jgi:hypothetical protein
MVDTLEYEMSTKKKENGLVLGFQKLRKINFGTKKNLNSSKKENIV